MTEMTQTAWQLTFLSASSLFAKCTDLKFCIGKHYSQMILFRLQSSCEKYQKSLDISIINTEIAEKDSSNRSRSHCLINLIENLNI